MAELVLIVRFAGQRVALPAAAVESVVEVEALAPVPGAAPHIAGLAALRSRVLTVVDCAASLAPGGRLPAESREAAVTVIDGHAYALLVEGVEDVVEAEAGQSPPLPLAGGWARISGGAVEAGGDLLLVADLAALIAGPPAAALSA